MVYHKVRHLGSDSTKPRRLRQYLASSVSLAGDRDGLWRTCSVAIIAGNGAGSNNSAVNSYVSWHAHASQSYLGLPQGEKKRLGLEHHLDEDL